MQFKQDSATKALSPQISLYLNRFLLSRTNYHAKIFEKFHVQIITQKLIHTKNMVNPHFAFFVVFIISRAYSPGEHPQYVLKNLIKWVWL